MFFVMEQCAVTWEQEELRSYTYTYSNSKPDDTYVTNCTKLPMKYLLLNIMMFFFFSIELGCFYRTSSSLCSLVTCSEIHLTCEVPLYYVVCTWEYSYPQVFSVGSLPYKWILSILLYILPVICLDRHMTFHQYFFWTWNIKL